MNGVLAFVTVNVLRLFGPAAQERRLACCGLAAAGAAGLVRTLELLEDEVRIAMGLLGVTRLSQLDTTYLRPATPVTLPHVTSAFPLLGEGY